MKKDLTLLIMAAGMGSRFGGLKQIEPIGPSGEFIIDYSVYDAIKAGFNKIVFIIKRENYKLFKETIGARIEDKIKVEYVFQDLNDLPNGVVVPDGRTKPWGTAHAIYAARNVIHEPFAAINADDFYGRDAFIKLANFLTNETNENIYSMIGYYTLNTLSENGSVNRGICFMKDHYLTKVVESTVNNEDNKIVAAPHDGSEKIVIKNDTLVSMNTYGFFPNLFQMIEREMIDFFQENTDSLDKCEFYIPSVVQNQIDANKISMKVISTTAKWHGISYLADKDSVVKSIQYYVDNNDYPENLWK